ncbi:hypothetical protein NDU88_002589 [Pleurodeles waltl]|uniref:Uncharacterized protein n=1 Tax=Pleurodeles waltl TaxID=8319 RepID=A0AAV7SB01_PLEWA|nr:hypothetical protein NDU88_002589 [Pleurodeles waltl]
MLLGRFSIIPPGAAKEVPSPDIGQAIWTWETQSCRTYVAGERSDALRLCTWNNVPTYLRRESHPEAVRRKARDIRGAAEARGERAVDRKMDRKEKDPRQQPRQPTEAATELPAKPKSLGGGLRPAIALEGHGYYRYEITYAVTYSLGHRGQERYREGL